MTEKNMREMGQAAEELLKLRGPKYNMSAHEAEVKLRELEKEESMERVYVCSQYGSRHEDRVRAPEGLHGAEDFHQHF